jgi:hypothetical protein
LLALDRVRQGQQVNRHTTIAATIIGFALGVSMPAQTAGQDIKDAGHESKEATKDVAKGTGKAAKTGAKKTGHAVKRGAHATASGARKGAEKVEDKTR